MAATVPERQPVDRHVEAAVHERQHRIPTPGAAAGPRGPAREARHGRRQSAKISAAEAIRSQATPSTSTRANSSTANAGPR